MLKLIFKKKFSYIFLSQQGLSLFWNSAATVSSTASKNKGKDKAKENRLVHSLTTSINVS